MIQDASTIVSNSQAITVTAYSTDTLPLSAAALTNSVASVATNFHGDPGAGHPIWMNFRITEAFAAAAPDLATINLQMGIALAIGSLGDISTTIVTSTESLNILKLLAVGDSWDVPLAGLPSWWTDAVYGPGGGVLGAAYVVSGGTFTGGRVTAGLVPNPRGRQRRYRDARN